MKHARNIGLCILTLFGLPAAVSRCVPPEPATFSIVAVDPDAGEAGVAVASRFFAVGTVVPHARAGAGAVATQSFGNTTYGPRGLDLLERGLSAEEVVRVLTPPAAKATRWAARTMTSWARSGMVALPNTVPCQLAIFTSCQIM